MKLLIPSNRALTIAASPIRSLLPYADRAKQEGKHIFHLNIGQPDIKTPLHAIEHLKNIKGNVLPNFGIHPQNYFESCPWPFSYLVGSYKVIQTRIIRYASIESGFV